MPEPTDLDTPVDGVRTFGSTGGAAGGGKSPGNGTPGDPDLEAPGALEETSTDEDDLRAELTADLIPTVTIPVPGRPRYSVTYRIDLITGKYLDKLRKRAKDKSYTDGIDGVRFASIGLAELCTAINRDDAPLELDGTVATFTHRAFQDLIGAPSALPALHKLYGGREGNIDAAMRKLMDEAGWGDDAVSVDPTTPTA